MDAGSQYPTAAFEAQPDVDDTDLADEGAREALDIANRFVELRAANRLEDCFYLLHPDIVMSMLTGTVEGIDGVRAIMTEGQIYNQIKGSYSAWKFVNHDLDDDSASPVIPRRLTPRRTVIVSNSAVAIYNNLRRRQRPNDPTVEDASTRFTLERTGWHYRSYHQFDFRYLNVRETMVVVDGLIRLYAQQIVQ